MKRLLFILLALCFISVAYAQVGIVRSGGYSAVQKVKKERVQKSVPASQELGPLTRNGNVYYYHGEAMTEAQMVQFINENCKQAYDYYQRHRKMEIAGWSLLGTGAAIGVGIGAGLLIAQETLSVGQARNTFVNVGAAFVCIGAITALTGASLGIAGIVLKKNTHKQYNKWCGYKELEESQAQASPLELKLTSGSNGLGLALSF